MWLRNKQQAHHTPTSRSFFGRRQAGDTIVEVLIAVAVASFMLTSAYTIVNAATNTTTDSQEHTQATQLLQAKIELLRDKLADSPNTFLGTSPDAGTLYCMNPSGARYKINGGTGNLPAATSDTYTEYNPDICQEDNLYYVSIQYDHGNDDSFTFRARWDKLGGGKTEVRLTYRIHAPISSLQLGQGGSTNNPNGSASINKQCSNPSMGNCTGGSSFQNEPPRYFWNVFLYNTSNNNGVGVASCVWTWHDSTGTTTTPNQHCENDGTGISHCYTSAMQADKITPITAVLKVTLDNGVTAISNSYSGSTPYKSTTYNPTAPTTLTCSTPAPPNP